MIACHLNKKRKLITLLRQYESSFARSQVGSSTKRSCLGSSIRSLLRLSTSHFHSAFLIQRHGIDLLGPFAKSRRGNRWVVLAVDYTTTYYMKTNAIPDASVARIAAFLLHHVVLRHGAPRDPISDRGRKLSFVLGSLLQASSVVHHTTLPYHPQTNGMTERINITLVDMLPMYVGVEQIH